MGSRAAESKGRPQEKKCSRVHHYHLDWLGVFWPNMSQDVSEVCQTCPQYQFGSKRGLPKAPLDSLLIMEVPSECIVMDLGRPLPWLTQGFSFLLVIVDYAMRYPEILTDRETTFTSALMMKLCYCLGIKQQFTTIYNPQTDRLVERMNQAIKDHWRLPR